LRRLKAYPYGQGNFTTYIRCYGFSEVLLYGYAMDFLFIKRVASQPCAMVKYGKRTSGI